MNVLIKLVKLIFLYLVNCLSINLERAIIKVKVLENKNFYNRFYNKGTDEASEELKNEVEEFRGFLDRVDISEFDATDRPKSLQYAEQKLYTVRTLNDSLVECSKKA